MVRRVKKLDDAKKIYDNKDKHKISVTDLCDDIEEWVNEENLEHVKKIFEWNFTKGTSDFIDYFSECNRDENTNYYVWIGINTTKSTDSDEFIDVVVVVGKAEFSKKARTNFGDLFKDYRFWGNVTQEVIMNLVSTEEEMKTLIEIEKKVNSFISRAIILSLDVTSKSEASKVEAEVGNFLLNNKEKKISILNKDSHNYP